MPRFVKQVRIGAGWIACGGRLFGRNPWLLGGMGVCSSALVTVLWMIPLLGAPLIALVAPMLLASFCLCIDRINIMTRPLPAALRAPAIKQSPRELLGVFREERRIMPILVVSLYSMFAGLITSILMWVIAGSAWSRSWADLSVRGWWAVSAAIAVALVLYFLLAASLAYALPRTFLRDKPLFSEMARSIKAGLHYLSALAMVLSLLLLPVLMGVLVSRASVSAAYGVAFAAGAVMLPLTACALYCSYRAIYQPRPPVAAHA